MSMLADELSAARARKLTQYGLTIGQFVEMYEAQDGSCATCLRPFGQARPPQIDHCHRTGAVRGLLCQRCNYEILGVLGDDPELYARIAGYLAVCPGDALDGGLGVIAPDSPPLAWEVG